MIYDARDLCYQEAEITACWEADDGHAQGKEIRRTMIARQVNFIL